MPKVSDIYLSLQHLTIGALSVAILITWAALVIPRVLESRSQLKDEQRADLYATAKVLQKMDSMCAEAGIADKSDAYLAASGAVVCVSFNGKEQIVGYLHGENKKANERFIGMHGYSPKS